MNKNTLIIIIFTLTASLWLNTYAEKYKGDKTSDANHPSGKVMAEACVPATGKTDLNINNVRARINTGGDMWWDLQNNPQYEIPQGSKKTSMFCAALWIAGTDVNGQLKCAAQRFRQSGNDYWTGPLTIDGSASVDAETCKLYDKHFIVTRGEVDQFIAWRKNPDKFPGYTIPKSILEWPAHGDVAKGQSYYLAPFKDVNDDGKYDPKNDGDYPLYDVNNSYCKKQDLTAEGNGILADQMIKGDQTIWWVFNDKGNIHTESSGSAIGMEIRAQAFAFTTNDEINNMTFYSYEIINRSTFRLTETYFSQWVDSDIGYAFDDYVGCDVIRGLGYCYNGKSVDGSGKPNEYGANPPACGVDFFQGPYMDADGMDNPKFKKNKLTGQYENCDFSINGVNFQDGIIDNERFGMRRFVYYNNDATVIGEPTLAVHYYNYLRGIWKDGTKMRYGGNGHINSGAYGPDCDFMFPDMTDVCDWGTGGLPPNGPKKWTEETANNEPKDRRFMQSAGPFTLEPGAVNYITVGIPWARATSGGPFASVELLRKVDDKCQSLFDHCFKVVDGPDAPELVIQELDRELILYISNNKLSNNYNENYVEYDPSIISPDTAVGKERYDSLYRFEGYQIFQLKDATVSISEISDPDKARLAFQCDLKNYDKNGNSVGRLINYYLDNDLQADIPKLEVDGTNKGISHTFRVLTDQFATGDNKLVNNKQYYFIALSYSYNEYLKYSADPQQQVAGYISNYGQKKPYLAGRKAAGGQPITPIAGIPHKIQSEFSGNAIYSKYGDGVKVTRIEGYGNGENILALTQETIDKIMSGPPYKVDAPEYKNGKSPINVKVIDPLTVQKSNYALKFVVQKAKIDSARWVLIKDYQTANEIVYSSDKTIQLANEQLFLDLGLSINIKQTKQPGSKDETDNDWQNGYLNPSAEDASFKEIEYADSSNMWASFVPDLDGYKFGALRYYNWIRSGTLVDVNDATINDYDYTGISQGAGLDDKEYFEKIISRTWGPYRLCSKYKYGPANPLNLAQNRMSNLSSVDIILTPDKSKWTRCAVIELCDDSLLSVNKVKKFDLRKGASLDKEGNPDGTGTGMSWFPGYAINIETGERLNIMFGENSWLIGENGNDMKYNPTSNYTSGLGDILWGGMHIVYVMGHNGNTVNDCPAYDEGKFIHTNLMNMTDKSRTNVYKSAMWVGIPMARTEKQWLGCDLTLRIRVTKPYGRYYNSAGDASTTPINDNYPMYTFNTNDIYTRNNVTDTAKSALDLIRIVPNPYYAYSKYEKNQLDMRVRITNLPEKCTISILSINGTLIRQFKVDKGPVSSMKKVGDIEFKTSIDWDLKNYAGIPISGGVYIFHIKADGIGEKVVKWFGAMRPTDVNSF